MQRKSCGVLATVGTTCENYTLCQSAPSGQRLHSTALSLKQSWTSVFSQKGRAITHVWYKKMTFHTQLRTKWLAFFQNVKLKLTCINSLSSRLLIFLCQHNLTFTSHGTTAKRENWLNFTTPFWEKCISTFIHDCFSRFCISSRQKSFCHMCRFITELSCWKYCTTTRFHPKLLLQDLCNVWRFLL